MTSDNILVDYLYKWVIHWSGRISTLYVTPLKNQETGCILMWVSMICFAFHFSCTLGNVYQTIKLPLVVLRRIRVRTAYEFWIINLSIILCSTYFDEFKKKHMANTYVDGMAYGLLCLFHAQVLAAWSSVRFQSGAGIGWRGNTYKGSLQMVSMHVILSETSSIGGCISVFAVFNKDWDASLQCIHKGLVAYILSQHLPLWV